MKYIYMNTEIHSLTGLEFMAELTGQKANLDEIKDWRTMAQHCSPNKKLCSQNEARIVEFYLKSGSLSHISHQL